MKDLTSFDGTLQMFRDTPKPVNWAHLCFLRWLVEQGRLEHPVCGPPSGEFAEALRHSGKAEQGEDFSKAPEIARRATRRASNRAADREASNP